MEDNDKAITALQRKEALKVIDVDNSGKMSLIEYLLWKVRGVFSFSRVVEFVGAYVGASTLDTCSTRKPFRKSPTRRKARTRRKSKVRVFVVFSYFSFTIIFNDTPQ